MIIINIYLELDSDIFELIELNVDIFEILWFENIDVEVIYGVGLYLLEEGVRIKNIVIKIIVSSVVVVIIFFIILQVLNDYYRKFYFVEYYEIYELKDVDGNFVLDKEGKL